MRFDTMSTTETKAQILALQEGQAQLLAGLNGLAALIKGQQPQPTDAETTEAVIVGSKARKARSDKAKRHAGRVTVAESSFEALPKRDNDYTEVPGTDRAGKATISKRWLTDDVREYVGDLLKDVQPSVYFCRCDQDGTPILDNRKRPQVIGGRLRKSATGSFQYVVEGMEAVIQLTDDDGNESTAVASAGMPVYLSVKEWYK
jgi:hypothetical protein